MKDNLPWIYSSTAIPNSPTTHKTFNFLQRSPLGVHLQLIKQFPGFYESLRFATIHAKAWHLSLSEPDVSTANPPIILKFYLYIFLLSIPRSSKWVFPFMFTYQSECSFLFLFRGNIIPNNFGNYLPVDIVLCPRKLEYCFYYIIRKYILTICSDRNYIFSHRIVHWVYNYMFRPCIFPIVRLYCKLNKQL